MPPATPPRPVIPHFALFGEPPSAGASPVLHIETIRHRSRPHGWEIGDHAHDSLLQVVIVRSGWVELRLDGRSSTHWGPVILSVPPGVVHAYRFDPAVQGDVISLSEGLFISPDDAELAALAEPLHAAPVVLAPARRALQAMASLLAQIRAETGSTRTGQPLMLGWLARCLLLWLYRLREAGRESQLPVAGATARLLRFRKLIERHYRERRDIGYYAAALGVTERALRRLCRDSAGSPPGRMIDERLAVEARRRLAYSHDPIAVIAYELGFEDPAYFSRFVRRLTGSSPLVLRRAGSS